MLITPDIVKAARLANERHFGQFDKQGMPYIMHPFSVANMCETEEQIIVALLHDILEDTETSEEELREMFSKQIVDAIVLLTRPENLTYKEYVAKVKENELATYVKLRDLAHNTDENRGPISDSLKERYAWAKEYLKN